MALEHNQQGHVPLEIAIYTGVNGLFSYHSGSVRMGSDQFSKNIPLPEPQTRFGSCIGLDLGPDFGQVCKSSGSNFGSGLNCSITSHLSESLQRRTTSELAQSSSKFW